MGHKKQYLDPKVRGECGVLAHTEDIRCFNWWWNSGSAFTLEVIAAE